ncbi:cytochrome P450 [Dactylosporangium sp. CA-139114]|uniref:cytochrome P450 n=1 Tax=Dactylosporangium sp. CA-139114 TaxID=3239931 RepID=UPI003D9646CD
MTAQPATTIDVDLNDTDAFVEGTEHRLWERLRREAPVHWNPTGSGGFWALTTYVDVLAALRDFETFSSEHGTVIGGSYRNGVDTAAGRMLVTSDPPRHRMLRRRMQRLFAPSMLERVNAEVVRRVGAALDRLWAAGGGDFAAEVAVELPAAALIAQLAIGPEDALRLVRLTRAMIGYRDSEFHGGIPDEARRLAAAQTGIFGFFLDLIDERRRHPGDDAVSSLLTPAPGERPLDEDALLFNLMNLVIGGNETTQHSASGGLVALMADPAQWERLRADPGLVPTSVEEFVRWTSTASYVQRTVTRPVRVRDVELGEGDAVTLWIASANRDAEQFVDPDRFDIGRTPNRHLGFASGPHHCIGAAVGRSGLRILLEGLRARPGRLVLAGDPVRLRSNFMLEFKSLPVEVAP